jgi:hypothetical protein
MFQILSFFYKQNLYLISVFGKSTVLLENKLRLSFAVDLEMSNVCFDKKQEKTGINHVVESIDQFVDDFG